MVSGGSYQRVGIVHSALNYGVHGADCSTNRMKCNLERPRSERRESISRVSSVRDYAELCGLALFRHAIDVFAGVDEQQVFDRCRPCFQPYEASGKPRYFNETGESCLGLGAFEVLVGLIESSRRRGTCPVPGVVPAVEFLPNIPGLSHVAPRRVARACATIRKKGLASECWAPVSTV